jgi:hypothetical protein
MAGAFPVRLAEEADAFDGTVSLEKTGVIVKDCAGPRWRYQSKSMLLGARVTAAPVIGAVADDFPARRKIGCSQEGLEGLRVVGLAWGYKTGNDQGGVRIDAEMDFAIGASLLPMDSGEPGIGASDLKAGGIDNDAAATLRPGRQDQVPAPAAQGGGTGSFTSESVRTERMRPIVCRSGSR